VSKLQRLAELGQSIWLDYIHRELLASGGLKEWIERGLRGVTSNPSIFDKAISGGSIYDDDLRGLVAEKESVSEIYEALVLDDIGQAAGILYPAYVETKGLDGYVSLEANPNLAYDAGKTVDEIRHFHAALGRPNVMYKVPATSVGYEAIETLIADGININITLIFSLDQYESVADAYMSGLEKRVSAGRDISQIASVASFFVSRVDTAVDRALYELRETDIMGRIAIANAKMAYARFQELLGTQRWQRLADCGARIQRPLRGSTSTKNPSYPDTLYVDSLIGEHTVNTVPPETLRAYLDHGRVASTITKGMAEAKAHLARLAELGIDLDEITDQLLVDGVDAFAESYESLMETISAKKKQLVKAA
jgi:transaldolase